MASIASGIGRPPLISTPSISKAKAKVSALGISGGVLMGVPGVSGEASEGEGEESSRFMEASSFLAVSIADAKLPKPPWCVLDRRWKSLSGTTTKWSSASISLSVAVMEERRRRAGLRTGGDSRASDVAILAVHGATKCGESGGLVGSTEETLERGRCTAVGDSQGRSGSYKNLENGDRETPSSPFALARAILTAPCLRMSLTYEKYGPRASDPVRLPKELEELWRPEVSFPNNGPTVRLETGPQIL